MTSSFRTTLTWLGILPAIATSLACFTNAASAAANPDNYVLLGTGVTNTGQLGLNTIDPVYTPTVITEGVTAVSTGNGQTLFIKSDKTLWGMGNNDDGELGQGAVTLTVDTPVQIDTDVVAISAGSNTSLYLKSDGSLYGMGDSEFGQLGTGKSESCHTPVLVATNVVQFCASYKDCYYITDDGTLYGMGVNADGELGLGHENYVFSAQVIDTDVSYVSAGGYSCHYVKNDGSLWAMGSNSFGELGYNSPTGRTTESTPVQIDTGVVKCADGESYCIYLKSNGNLLACGNNYYGQLGIGQQDTVFFHTPQLVDTSVDDIFAGQRHSMYLKNGVLYASGDNSTGQFGRGSHARTAFYTPVAISENAVAAAGGYDCSLIILSDFHSPYWPCGTGGCKYDSILGWIDDTFYPWVYSYDFNFWYYVYGEEDASLYQGYWIAYISDDPSSEMSTYGWGYVQDTAGGWWCASWTLEGWIWVEAALQ